MQERTVSDHRYLTDLELLFWLLGDDPRMRTSFAAVSLVDRPLEVDRLSERMERATVALPRLRQRVEQALGPMSPAVWIDDPDFDIELHVHEVQVPGATRNDISKMAVSVADEAFPADRPLWELVAIHGGEGQSALIWKFHHALADGIGAIRLSEQFVDLERDPETRNTQRSTPPLDRPNSVSMVIGSAAHGTEQVVKAVAAGVGEATLLALRPDQWPEAVNQVKAAFSQTSFGAKGERSEVWAERSGDRSLHLLEVDFVDAKAAGAAAGGTLNHFFVAGAIQAAARYHADMGTERHRFRMAMPISTRADGSAGGNNFSPVQFDMNATARVGDQIPAVTAALSQPDSADGNQGLMNAATRVGSLLPPPLVRLAARSQTKSVDFTTSNVRGAPFDLYAGGAKLLTNHPIGPVAGTAFNLTMMSYSGQLCLGLHCDTAAITDSALLATHLQASYDELLAV